MPETIVPYQEHHFHDKLLDIGVAWDGTRVWVCLNGIALLRAKINPITKNNLMIEFTPPESYG